MKDKYYIELHKSIAYFIEKFGIENYDEKSFKNIFKLGWNSKDYSDDPYDNEPCIQK